MADEPLPSGWLPPRPPAHPTSPEAPVRSRGPWPPPGRQGPDAGRGEPEPPSSPLAVSAIAVSCLAILMVVLSAGVWYGPSLVVALGGLLLARRVQAMARAGRPIRPRQARTAMRCAAVAIAVAGLAALVWAVLAANGITPQDLIDWLERRREQLQRS